MGGMSREEVQGEYNTKRGQRSKEMRTGKKLGYFGKVLFGVMVLCGIFLSQRVSVRAADLEKDTIKLEFDGVSHKLTATASLASKADTESDADTYKLRIVNKSAPEANLVESTTATGRAESAAKTLTLEYIIPAGNIDTLFPPIDEANTSTHLFYADIYNEGNTKYKRFEIEVTRYKVTAASSDTAKGTVTPTGAVWKFVGEENVAIAATPVSTTGNESAFVSWTGATFSGTDKPTTSYKASDSIVVSSETGNAATANFAGITIGGNSTIPNNYESTFTIDSPLETEHYSKIEWTVSDATDLTAPANGKISESKDSISITPALSEGKTSGSFKLKVDFYDAANALVGSKTETITVKGNFSILTMPLYGTGTVTPVKTGYKVLQRMGSSNLLLYVPKDEAYGDVTWTAPASTTTAHLTPSTSATTINGSTYYYATVQPRSSTGLYTVSADVAFPTPTPGPGGALGIDNNTGFSGDITVEVAEIKGDNIYLPIDGSATYSVSATAAAPTVFDPDNTVWDTGAYANLTFDPAAKKGASIKLTPNTAAKAGDMFTLKATLYKGDVKVGELTKELYIGGYIDVSILDDYITAGYNTEAEAYITGETGGTINWILDGAGLNNRKATGDTVKFQGSKEGTITATATVGTLIGEDTVDVYSKPTISASVSNSSSVIVSWSLPDMVNNGALSSSKQVYIDSVDSGYYLLSYGGSTLRSDTNADLDSSTQYSASSLNSEIRTKSGSAIEAKIYPQGYGYDSRDDDSDIEKTESPIYASATIPVASVKISGSGLNSATYYGIVGTPISVTASSSNSPFIYWTDSGASGNTNPTRTITIPSGGTSLTGIAGSSRSTSTSTSTSSSARSSTGGSGGTGGGGYDSVPKTGQGNTFLYVLIAMLACAAFATVFMVKSMRAGTEAAGEGGTAPTELSETKKSPEKEKKDDWDNI